MAGFLIFLGIATVVGLIIWGAVAAYRKEQARIRSLLQLAMSKGWQFSAADPYNLPERWDGVPFDSGYARNARNVITGAIGDRPMIAFDYSYKEDSTDSKGNRSTTTYHFGICALAMPCPLPELHVGPEGVFSRIGSMLGFQDIELESEDFNRRFRVRCPDPKLATDVLAPRTMELLLHYGKVHFRFVGTDAVCYESGTLQPADVLNRTALLANVLAGVPAFVWKDHTPT